MGVGAMSVVHTCATEAAGTRTRTRACATTLTKRGKARCGGVERHVGVCHGLVERRRAKDVVDVHSLARRSHQAVAVTRVGVNPMTTPAATNRSGQVRLRGQSAQGVTIIAITIIILIATLVAGALAVT